MLVIAVAVPWTVLLYGLAPRLFPYLTPDPDVVAHVVPYARARFVAIAAVGINYAFRGHWNGTNRSRLYMRTLVLMHACNVFLNWVFIFGNLGAPALGAHGAGVASAIATYLGAAYYVALGFHHSRAKGFVRGLPDRESVATIVRLALPTSVQQLLFSAGFTTLFWIIGMVGTPETAAANVLINVMLVAILPAVALGTSATSLVGQALGRGDPADARAWGWDLVRIGLVVLVVLGLPMLLVPDAILGVFLHDPHTRELARVPLMVFGAGIWMNAFGLVLQHALLGAGANRLTMMVSVALQWGLYLPASYLVGPVLGYGLLGIWVAQVGYFAAQGLAFATLWHRGRWIGIKV
jgi:putative MATE family efflux protein